MPISKQRSWGRDILVPIVALAFLALIVVLLQQFSTSFSSPSATPSLQVLHSPPLLVLEEEAVELEYEYVCPDAGPPTMGSCAVGGSVHIRRDGEIEFRQFPLLESGPSPSARLHTPVPSEFLSGNGFSYYATLKDGKENLNVILPAGGASAPHRVRVLAESAFVELQPADFGRAREEEGHKSVRARWGGGVGEVGLHAGKERATMGPGSFDVSPDGRVWIMDQWNQRISVFGMGGSVRNIPVEIRGGSPDIALGLGGVIHILENRGFGRSNPLVKSFDVEGKLLNSVAIAEPIPSRIRIDSEGLKVYQYPSSLWMPVLSSTGSALAITDQFRGGRSGLTQPDGSKLVGRISYRELRIAQVLGDGVARSWQIVNRSNDQNFGDLQLVQILHGDLIVVFGTWSETDAMFRVLRIDHKGQVMRDFGLERGEWAESAALSRFRLGSDGVLYHMGSNPSGLTINGYRVWESKA